MRCYRGVNNAGLSIPTARGHLRSEMTSLLNTATMILYSYCIGISLVFNLFDVIIAFSIVDNDGMSISAARGRSWPELRSSFVSLTSILYRWCV